MNSLFVSSHYPLPARDGVTLPFSNYARLFQEQGGSVDLLVLEKQVDTKYLKANQDFFRNVFRLPIHATPLSSRVVGQLVGRTPYFSGWKAAQALSEELRAESYDVVLSTPRAVVTLVDELRKSGQLNARVHVAAVNDMAALVKSNLARAALQGPRSLNDLRRFVKFRLQNFGLRAAEFNLLAHCCDLFIVQSKSEADWVHRQGTPELAEKMLQLSNGVDDIFFDIGLEKPGQTCTFVGSIAGEYAQRMDWLIDHVWSPTAQAYPDAQFTVSGKCEIPQLLTKFAQQKIIHRSFLPDPKDLYHDQSVLLAPIFKGYGLINKVIQSMAAGTLVIGDKTAFNAIPDFQDGVHGLVANTPEEFIKQLGFAFDNSDRLITMRRAARELIRKHFAWIDRFTALNNKLQVLLTNKELL